MRQKRPTPQRVGALKPLAEILATLGYFPSTAEAIRRLSPEQLKALTSNYREFWRESSRILSQMYVEGAQLRTAQIWAERYKRWADQTADRYYQAYENNDYQGMVQAIATHEKAVARYYQNKARMEKAQEKLEQLQRDLRALASYWEFSPVTAPETPAPTKPTPPPAPPPPPQPQAAPPEEVERIRAEIQRLLDLMVELNPLVTEISLRIRAAEDELATLRKLHQFYLDRNDYPNANLTMARITQLEALLKELREDLATVAQSYEDLYARYEALKQRLAELGYNP